MRNLLKKFHIVSNQSEDAEGSGSLRGSHPSEHNRPFSSLSSWLQSVASKHGSSTPSSSNETRSERMEGSDSVSTSSRTADVIGQDGTLREPGSGNSRDPDVEEEYQIQLALELSAREDPEAVQIEAVKQISLGSCSSDNTPAEITAYRYWNYNSLGYDDKILDGFYDLYGVLNESTFGRMPSLVDLQGTSILDSVAWEAVLVNRSADSKLLQLEDKALEIAVKLRLGPRVPQQADLVRALALLVSEYMGGPVGNPDNMLRSWRSLVSRLKSTHGSMVLPLGSLTIGLARHRALLFKVLADSVSIHCRLVKGYQYTGSADVAMNFVKIDDGREYIVDLMADPGTLIPSDTTGSFLECDESLFPARPLSEDTNASRGACSGNTLSSFIEGASCIGAIINEAKEWSETSSAKSKSRNSSTQKKRVPASGLPQRPNYPYSHARSPSWTEGVSSPAAHQMKVRDVSQYMIDAANENPQLAQKLHDVLLESGVVAPPNLFSEVYPKQVKVEAKVQIQTEACKRPDDRDRSISLPPRPPPRPQEIHMERHTPMEASALNSPVESQVKGQPLASLPDVGPVKYTKEVPVAAAAAAAAAVMASSMVVAAAKSSTSESSCLDLPVAAAATATAAAVVATTTAVNKKYEHGPQGDGETNSSNQEPDDFVGVNSEGERERVSDRSAGDDSVKSDVAMDDVADYEIQWEEITLGSYGEVYHGDWHGTEVAVKKFLDQDISGESLEEFKSEIRIMKKVRHPNVVLFMGAVTRVPNLSIITEFLPRGSLYRLLHRPNNQLDERRRLRMALDAARGMNYLHNCNPVIVHRDLKSPNLLVDKNWVLKVCDFGLSRMKHSTFLSSRSAAGTAEWMAPEVLRNEPSNEKCDVYSFGVILWELITLKQPWGGMNPMQVVGAVGFQHRRLEIPDDMNPAIADIIKKCWQTDPKLRPSFTEIMAALKPLQKPIIGPQVLRLSASRPANTREC
ncbi:probable serine/threonine-protein kinase SIS8 isoform X2 [Punica granatum]|uniref:non-specific serine/threonine protein kinase n=1 Tax=Punica granatum TaxID=22663 RepID=A0A6P8EJE5_PUNGR|nr:probable serine/threonine-protein kinase SIS8 isoform X2 [Punica granatum]